MDDIEQHLSPTDTNLELRMPYLDQFETDFQNQVQMEEDEEKKKQEKLAKENKQVPLALKFRSHRNI